ncbi:hypothetical protein O0L34_g10011 [Tuta absoluta]|nr:hypothetical protein O0L34_g10011 [Tuta absoluta]
MEEELNENELEERFYSMLHYVDDSQANVTTNQDALKIIENAPRSTLRRYWRTSGDHTAATPLNTPFQKVNTPKEAPKPPTEDPKPKAEKPTHVVEPLPKHLSLFNSPVPKDIKKTIEILENDDDDVVELQSSDEDEVIEVALPPKPTITIESSDDEEIPLHDTPTKTKQAVPLEKSSCGEREISASPVPSIVSSVSDEFIRGDCIALNISSHHPDNPKFDFSLHGADILGSTPKKKKRKKNKESATSTPISVESTQNNIVVDTCFATPKSKTKNKKQRNKSYVVKETSIPNADVYDSDSNQSTIDINKSQNSYVVSEKSLPFADVYETDSNPSETPRPATQKASNDNDVDSSDCSISLDKSHEATPKNTKKDTLQITGVTIDLTDNVPDNEHIEENIIMGNVTGFTESEDYEEPVTTDQNIVPKFGSTKVPAILYENLDFDNLKGKEKVCKNRRYSLTTLRAEMEKFYNESWGGEDFNHREIQKNMSRDKSLWAIDPKDKMASFNRKRYNVTCNYCNRPGHRDDTCRLKPPVCFMCGNSGHMEPRCPSKICVNCGSPNHMYSTMCRNCCNWGRVRCAECGQPGHPPTHCPDLWRRYHNTTDITAYLEENRFTKKHNQMFCSGCTRRGHLVHTCRLSLPFSGLPINSPYVSLYRPVYAPLPDTNLPDGNRTKQIKNFQDSTVDSATTPSRNENNKRLSKSPCVHETHVNKKRNTSMSDILEATPKQQRPEQQRKRSQSQSKEPAEESVKENIEKQQQKATFETVEKAPDFIPIFSNNHDKKGRVIQDNEVSDTSDVVTSARIYVTPDVIDKLKTDDGVAWLNETCKKLQVVIEKIDNKLFLSIKGKVGDQETFQVMIRDWAKDRANIGHDDSHNDADSSVLQPASVTEKSLIDNIPKSKYNALRHINRALKSLEKDVGEPNGLYKELNYLQNRHHKLLNAKVISGTQLENSRNHINAILKKLNMVLLGQAGLAGGSKHIKALHVLQTKLVNCRDKTISNQLRQDIGQHFQCIFTACPRNDYCQLLQSYNTLPNAKKTQNKKKTINLNAKAKKVDTIPPQNQQKNHQKNGFNTSIENSKPDVVQNNGPNFKKPQTERPIAVSKLYFFRKRLLKARPSDSVLKKTRLELVRKLHTFINLLGANPNTSAKNLKKIRKVQDQAQLFLNNV